MIAIDETVVEKSGKHTHGKHKFYSSVFKGVVDGIYFMALSLINIEERRSYSIAQEQVVVTELDKARIEAKKKDKKAVSKGKVKRGRPKIRIN